MAILSVDELSTSVLEAFKVRNPALMMFGTDFSSDTVRMGQTIQARIPKIPTVEDYDPVNGYKSSTNRANSLLDDVPVTINRHKFVTVEMNYLDEISTNRELYDAATSDMAYALGKEAFDYGMSLVVAANFTHQVVKSVPASDKSMLDEVAALMNKNGAGGSRVGVVNSDVYQTLEGDPRISSGDYHAQRRQGEPYGELENLAGFQRIFEYPDMPTNAQDLTSFFSDRSALAIAARLPTDASDLANRLGIPRNADSRVTQDPESGLALLSYTWEDTGNPNIYTSLIWCYGVSAGKQGGVAGTITDNGGARVVEA